MPDLTQALDRLDRWWRNLPDDQRQVLYRPDTLIRAAGIARADLPHALALAGWHRAARWLIGDDGRRKKRVFYAPPGHQVPDAAPRGRPPTTIFTILNQQRPSPLFINVDESA